MIRLALVHRDHPRMAEARMIGAWSYTVPEFQVTRFPVSKWFRLDRTQFDAYDVVFWEDSRTDGTWTGTGKTPVVYHVADSTLSEEHYAHRYAQAMQADAVLVDWDDLARFDSLGVPVRRMAYCVNQKLFRPQTKTMDVGFFAKMDEARREVFYWLKDFCAQHGYSFDGGLREGADYVRCLGSAKVNVNMGRTPNTRNHRCYDVMASQSCLITTPMPPVSGEDWRAGEHYLEWSDMNELGAQLKAALAGHWLTLAQSGYDYVSRLHTWEHRARQLHATLCEAFPEIGARAHVH